jgi:hypothetical protein
MLFRYDIVAREAALPYPFMEERTCPRVSAWVLEGSSREKGDRRIFEHDFSDDVVGVRHGTLPHRRSAKPLVVELRNSGLGAFRISATDEHILTAHEFEHVLDQAELLSTPWRKGHPF